MRYFVDLKPYFNFRMAYPKDKVLSETDYIAVHNYFYFQEDMEWGIIGDNQAEINLERTSNFDCIECNSQTIDLDDIAAKKIIIAGASSWGLFNEKFQLEYSDKTYEAIPIYLGEWSHPIEMHTRHMFEAETADYTKCNLLRKYRHRAGQAFIYYNVKELSESKEIRKIIFPDNICMFIFGITLES